MKKTGKTLTVLCVAAGAAGAVALAREARRTRQAEQALEQMPLHQLREKFAAVRRESGRTVVTVPDEMLLADRLRVCAGILRKPKGGAEDAQG